MKWQGASCADRGRRRPLRPEFRGPLALRVFSTSRYRGLSPAGASAPLPGVRPASRPCFRRSVPSARFPQARQFRLRRHPPEGSEHGPREMIEDCLDHHRSVDAPNAVQGCTNAARAGCAGAASLNAAPQCSQVSIQAPPRSAAAPGERPTARPSSPTRRATPAPMMRASSRPGADWVLASDMTGTCS